MSAHATLRGTITNIGGENCNQRGFDWDYDSGAPYTYSWIQSGSYGTGSFSHQVTGLTEEVTVYFRAKAHNSAGWGYGGEKSFVTPKAWSKTLSEKLGLLDKAVKAPSVVKTEPLGLLDTYSRTWAIYRVYPEILGLSDTVVATRLLTKVLTELLGLSDTLVKEPGKVLNEFLGLVDAYGRTWSVYRTYDELLGLADSIQKDIALHPLIETLGLLDTYDRTWAIQRTYTEALGLEDRVSKHVSLHALTEVLGLLDSISYGKNLTILAKLIRKFIQLESIGGGGER